MSVAKVNLVPDLDAYRDAWHLVRARLGMPEVGES